MLVLDVHVNHHPPVGLAGDRIPVVEFQVELQDIHRGLAEESQVAAATVLRQDRTNLIGLTCRALATLLTWMSA